MKIIITSTDALIDKRTNTFFPGILDALRYFKTLVPGNEVMVLSGHADSLDAIPAEFHPVNIPLKFRGSDYPIQLIMDNNPTFGDRGKIFILAANDADLRTAANSKVLLLSAIYSKSNNPTSRVFDYGIKVSNIASLTQFFERFSNINKPWFFNLSLGNSFTSYALINANSMGLRSEDAFDISDKFQQCIKQGNITYREALAKYFLMSVYQIVNTVESVDVWAIYPSSASSTNPDLEYFKDLARKAFNKRAVEPLFIRHTPAAKRHKTAKSIRLADGCDSQFATMHLNPYYRGKIEDKTICIIDDFNTYGSSSEASRNLLLAAGAAKVIFISLGKFGREYIKIDYEFDGDLYSPGYKYRKKYTASVDGNFNNTADGAMLDSLKGIV